MKVVGNIIYEPSMVIKNPDELTHFDFKLGEIYILNTDAYSGIYSLPDESIDVVITSPPYYKQRDYGFQGQIGQEDTPEEYIDNLSKIFFLLKGKLSAKGVLFINIGDKYIARYGKSNLAQIPYRLGLRLQEQGWYLCDILIWYKPNHMPSPVKDRFVNSYEPILVFSKSRDSYYIQKDKVMNIPLEPTRYKHTAVFPRRLVLELLKRTDIAKIKTVLDPFAGTGTVGEVSKKLSKTCLLIEPLSEYVEIIRERINSPYNSDLTKTKEELEFLESKEEAEIFVKYKTSQGMVDICKDAYEFQALLEQMKTGEFKKDFSKSALFFVGCKDVSLEVLTKPYFLTLNGYVLRNMIVVKYGKNWFPVFMLAFDTKKFEYKFNAAFSNENKIQTVKVKIGVNTRVNDNLNKRRGYVRKVIEYYQDGLPSTVEVEWEDGVKEIQSVLHPKDEIIRESILFICPFCNTELDREITDKCNKCGKNLWVNSYSVPRMAVKVFLQRPNFIVKCLQDRGVMVKERSKYENLSSYNWGASPGARKKVIGDMLTKIRLYDIPQPFFARFLKVLMREKGISIKKLLDIFGDNYKHTIPHWIREDFGGSLPTQKDLIILEEVFGYTEWFSVLKLTVLKIQTVKPNLKGKMPEDFLDLKDTSIFLKIFQN